ncbi:hypothetical protein [Streptosporangium vulgare]|uniref:hypothetical protein n=1 Tax=Streptosporangium vulgare TaxID=46190 RepID=UPI0031E010D1
MDDKTAAGNRLGLLIVGLVLMILSALTIARGARGVSRRHRRAALSWTLGTPAVRHLRPVAVVG